MVRSSRLILSVGFLAVLARSPCLAMEFEAADILHKDELLPVAVKRIGKSLNGNGRVSKSRFANNFTTSVAKAKFEVGKRTLSKPVTVRLDLAARPVGAPQRLKVEPIMNLSASREIAPSIPGNVEVLVAPRVGEDSSVQVLYRVSF